MNEDQAVKSMLIGLITLLVLLVISMAFNSQLRAILTGGEKDLCAITAAMQGYEQGLICYQEEIGVSW